MPTKREGDEPVGARKKTAGDAARRRASASGSKRAGRKKVQETQQPAEPRAVEEPVAESAPPQEAPPSEPESVREAPAEEAEMPEAQPLVVYDLLREFATVLSLFAWQRLGLMMDPLTGKIHRDLPQARVAIDTFGHLVEQIGDNAAEEHQRALRATLADLRINFVEQSKRL